MYLYGRVDKSKPLKTEAAGGIPPCAFSLQVFFQPIIIRDVAKRQLQN